MPGRMLREFLDRNRVKYVAMSHSTAYTAQEVAAATHIHGKEVAKTVMVKIDGKPAMAVLPASRRIDFARLKTAASAAAVNLATEAEFKTLFPDCETGAMPPFGNLYGLPVFADRTLTEDEDIAFNACSHTDLIRMAYKDFENLVHPTIADFA